MLKEIVESIDESIAKKRFDGHDFSWDGKEITMSKDGKEISKQDAPSFSSTQMKMMIKAQK